MFILLAAVIEPHSETFPSLRLTQPFPALLEWATSTDYEKLDPTEHAHIPFPIILVKSAEKWKAEVSTRTFITRLQY